MSRYFGAPGFSSRSLTRLPGEQSRRSSICCLETLSLSRLSDLQSAIKADSPAQTGESGSLCSPLVARVASAEAMALKVQAPSNISGPSNEREHSSTPSEVEAGAGAAKKALCVRCVRAKFAKVRSCARHKKANGCALCPWLSLFLSLLHHSSRIASGQREMRRWVCACLRRRSSRFSLASRSAQLKTQPIRRADLN